MVSSHRKHRGSFHTLKQRTISSDLTVGIALTIIVVTTALSLLVYLASLSRSQEHLEAQAEDMADKLVVALTLPLWDVNRHAVEMVADAYAQSPNVVGLRIVDDTNSVIFEKPVPNEPDVIIVSRSVRYREQEIGGVRVALTTRDIHAAHKRTLIFTLAVMVCVTLVVIVVIRILLKVFLSRPLAELAGKLKTIASGSYDQYLPPVRQQDIDTIINDVNSMAAQIQQRDNELRESRKRYQELVNLLPETIYETDAEGRFLFLSRSGRNAFGLSEEDLERGLSVDDLFAEKDLRLIHDDMEKALAGEPVGATEYTAVRKDGTRFSVLVHSNAIVRDQRPLGIRAIAVDITNRKQLEEKLVRLAAGIAHQVRNPLMSIGGFALRLQKRYAEEKDLQAWLQIILLEVQRLERMVADIHELVTFLELELKETSIPELLDALLAEWGQRLEAAGIRVHQKIPYGLPGVTADPYLLTVAFEKVLDNALEAMSEGGDMEIEVYERSGQVCVVFKDNGPGISKEDLPHVCEPFYGSKPKSSGLGLTVAHRILQKHRGRVAIRSSRGRGTRAELCVPSLPPEST